MSHSAVWPALPKCVGASSATTRSSSRRSGSDTTRAADGRASTTTARCASQSMDSWSPNGGRSPPQNLVPPGGSRNLPFPKVTDPAAPPIRPRCCRGVPVARAASHETRVVFYDAVRAQLLDDIVAQFRNAEPHLFKDAADYE